MTLHEIYNNHKDQFRKKLSKQAEQKRALKMEQNAREGKRSKYGSKQVVFDNIIFHSTGEGYYYLELKDQVNRGMIAEFKRQVVFPLVVNGVHITTYRCDFITKDFGGNYQVIDFKGYETEEYKIKRQLMIACYGIAIKEIKSK